MFETILKLAEKYCEDPSLELDRDTSVVMDMELSSMSIFSMISELEDSLNIRIPERILLRVDTLGDLCDVVESLM